MKTILLLEPDRETADIIAEYMHQHELGAGISHVASAQAAVHRADEVAPDVLILELAIPEHNGLAFLHEFRSYPEWNTIPVIIHTMLPLEQTGISAQEMQQLGIRQYLYKPTTSLDKLHKVILGELGE